MKPTWSPTLGIVAPVSGDVVLLGARWKIGNAHFASPVDVLVAETADQVAHVVRAAESAATAGYWVAGYIAYDAAPGFDPHLIVPGPSKMPLAWFGVYENHSEPESSPGPVGVGEWTPSMTRQQHAASVESIIESIEKGDTYQANLTFAMKARLEGSALDLLVSMAQAQSKSFGAYLDLGDVEVISISPELFLAGSGRHVRTQPMKGTAPRGRSAAEDDKMRLALEESEKEAAGNVMVVDLLRNDLGRVSETDSVGVTELLKPERHPTVWQLTSTVEGQLRGEVGLFELLQATFPSGSVTGAPKVSTMEIIAANETVPRGVYCGAIGYLAPGGEAYEFSVAIRTGVVSDNYLTYHVGGGITFDSMAGAEYEECLWKALVVNSRDRTPDLVETMRYEPDTGIPMLAAHLRRLTASANYWEIPLDLASVGEALSGVEGSRPLKVRLVLGRNGDIDLEHEEIEMVGEPVQLQVSKSGIDPTDPLWFHKTTERSRYPDPDDGEVVLFNVNGQVTETNISNLMVRIDDEWVTPPIESGCLPGVFRQTLIDAREVRERVVTVDELRSAEEIAVTNAVQGYRKAVLIR